MYIFSLFYLNILDGLTLVIYFKNLYLFKIYLMAGFIFHRCKMKRDYNFSASFFEVYYLNLH